MLDIKILSFLFILGSIKTKYTQIICINTKDDNWLSKIGCKLLENKLFKKSDFNQLNI